MPITHTGISKWSSDLIITISTAVLSTLFNQPVWCTFHSFESIDHFSSNNPILSLSNCYPSSVGRTHLYAHHLMTVLNIEWQLGCMNETLQIKLLRQNHSYCFMHTFKVTQTGWATSVFSDSRNLNFILLHIRLFIGSQDQEWNQWYFSRIRNKQFAVARKLYATLKLRGKNEVLTFENNFPHQRNYGQNWSQSDQNLVSCRKFKSWIQSPPPPQDL